MIPVTSIAHQFRLSFFLFAVLLCTTFVSIFLYAEARIERELVKARLIQQLVLSQKFEGEKPIYRAAPGITIYRFDHAPKGLKALASDTVKEISVTVNVNNQPRQTNLHFFKYLDERPTAFKQSYVLTYLEDRDLTMENYPVLAIFEHLEGTFARALKLAVILSLIIAAVFSQLSSKRITKSLLALKQAVESDSQNLTKLTRLPTEVGVLARAIDEKNHKLEQYLKREQLFTGDVSHELRTPLTIIMGAAEVLAAQLDKGSELRPFADRISDTAKDTSEIISALLLLSRDPEALDAPTTSINRIAYEEASRLQYLLRYKPVRFQVAAHGEFTANVRPELLKMALGNLIKNAFQYTDEGEVVIAIDDTKITVTDTGLGIPDAMMPLLYERFERLTPRGDNSHNDHNHQSQAYSVEGSGLGLSIVQRIITHLGWQLSHQPHATGGSIFTIYYH